MAEQAGFGQKRKQISITVIKRLPRYYRYLSNLLASGVMRISSGELSERMGVTASQIRQDLNNFGGFGQQGYGYNVELLHSEIGKLLGIHHNYKTIIIGAGNMGRALANHRLFEKRGFINEAIFDINPDVVGSMINHYQVLHMDQLESFVAEHPVDIAILCIPNTQTAAVAERVASLGIRGLWNFSPMDLKLDREVVIENVHLGDGLMLLGYRLSCRDCQKK